VSADTVVPDFASPQDLNRYSYVRNNPLRYSDPSGHWLFEGTPDDKFTWSRDKEYPGMVKAASPDSLMNWEETQGPPNLVPDLYIEGVSGRAGPAKGGFEQVYDFTTNEVGFFDYGGGEIGTDLFGGDVNGYIGLGYKGSMMGYNLAEAYKGGFYTAGGSGQLPGDLVSAGLDLSVSANGLVTGSNLPTPRFDAVKTVTIGGGFGGSTSPLPGEGHLAATNYNYHGGPPPMSDQEMIIYVWANEWRQPEKASFLTFLTLANSP
jgi:hypothetical protein